MSSSEPIDYKAIFEPVEHAAAMWRDAPDRLFATEQARAIFREVLPPVLERFVRKNADYGNTAAFLGARGQFADLNPKFWKLKKALWDGDKLLGESIEEICSDLVGHALLTIYFLALERSEKDLADHKPHPGGPPLDANPLPQHTPFCDDEECAEDCPVRALKAEDLAGIEDVGAYEKALRSMEKNEVRKEFRRQFPDMPIPSTRVMVSALIEKRGGK